MSLIENAKDNDLQAVKGLIVGGADVNAVDGNGRTALWYAAAWGYVECATALLDGKADVNKASNKGDTPLHYASHNGRPEYVRLLIQNKANVNALNINASSPLHLASAFGHLACVQILIAAGAERDRHSNFGDTSLTNSVRRDHRNVAEYLLHSGAKMSNINPSIEIPPWMIDILAKRCTVISVILTLKGVLKWRLGIYKDVTHLIALYVWRIRLK